MTEPWGTRCDRLIPGSPVPLARSRTRMPGIGHEYSTKASVTALPSTADFAFHFSAATRRKEEPHGAGFEADTQAFFLRVFLGAAAGLPVADFVAVALAIVARRSFGFAISSAGSSRLADFHRRSRS